MPKTLLNITKIIPPFSTPPPQLLSYNNFLKLIKSAYGQFNLRRRFREIKTLAGARVCYIKRPYKIYGSRTA